MPPSQILDSHIHLWPSTSLSPSSHAWMTTPSHPLAKRHGTADYLAATHPVKPACVYVETDRTLLGEVPNVEEGDGEGGIEEGLKVWAHEKLEELRFLRRIVEGNVGDSDGVEVGKEEGVVKGFVIWAPFHLSPPLFNAYLRIAEDVAGPQLWAKVVGFRYLLQGKGEGVVQELVSRGAWVENIVGLGGRWAFDVGVDVNRDGEEGLEAVGNMIREVRSMKGGEGVKFVLNHLCKPPLSLTPSPRWTSALERLSSDTKVYMKLSGAFNEFVSTPSSVEDITTALSPFLDVIFAAFPNRIMFGSDWPVCNVGGPRGEEGNWKFWVEVVERVLVERGLSEEEKEGVWWRTGKGVYGIDSL
ncbi:hypothetical protein CC86DRAFT_374438 [Ophiobolus disseminans]|uniref:Amidohydrolase-related domain-containing protein n=1 Tax=Ophiobolus disseminans TaxID=1469910 RepID=A0A6A6ZHK0_9PLEO|nr:hypothetical protein CC86DRAFT_374438 [Ophiobolus disseminans]